VILGQGVAGSNPAAPTMQDWVSARQMADPQFVSHSQRRFVGRIGTRGRGFSAGGGRRSDNARLGVRQTDGGSSIRQPLTEEVRGTNWDKGSRVQIPPLRRCKIGCPPDRWRILNSSATHRGGSWDELGQGVARSPPEADAAPTTNTTQPRHYIPNY
jgi:hypothetical protein